MDWSEIGRRFESAALEPYDEQRVWGLLELTGAKLLCDPNLTYFVEQLQWKRAMQLPSDAFASLIEFGRPGDVEWRARMGHGETGVDRATVRESLYPQVIHTLEYVERSRRGDPSRHVDQEDGNVASFVERGLGFEALLAARDDGLSGSRDHIPRWSITLGEGDLNTISLLSPWVGCDHPGSAWWRQFLRSAASCCVAWGKANGTAFPVHDRDRTDPFVDLHENAFVVGDSQGEAARYPTSRFIGWVVRALFEQRGDSVQVAEIVAAAERARLSAEDSGLSVAVADFTHTQQRPATRDPVDYSQDSPAKAVEKLQSNLRRGQGRSYREWSSRWLKFDRSAGTVTFLAADGIRTG